MIRTAQTDHGWEQGPVTIRALRSLSRQGLDAVSDALRGVPGHWAVDQQEDYDGYLSILICSEGDADTATYLISGQVDEIELARLQADQLHTLGRFGDIEATTAELVRALKLHAAR